MLLKLQFGGGIPGKGKELTLPNETIVIFIGVMFKHL